VEEPHQRLVIDAQGTVVTKNRYADAEPRGVPLSELSSVAGTYEVHQLLQESRYVKISPEIWRAAVDAIQGQTNVFEAGVAIMEHLHGRCIYLTGVTGVSTTSLEFFDDSRGVCQDFAHLMLAMCRSLQIPARYVSGYLYDPTRKELRGAHASHAWCEIYVPGGGWFGLDPTNRRLADDHYVVLAIGRDYDDVAPVKGTFYGSTRCDMAVTVHLEEA
jgi:transglutaminase-like putative cysteine protease